MTSTPDNAAPLITNSFGNPVKFQSILQWVDQVNTITQPEGLTMMWKDLIRGSQGHARIHRFMYGTADYKAASNAIFRRAEKIRCHYSKVSRIFTWD